MGATQRAAQWVPEFLPWQSCRGVKLTTHLHLVQRVRMSGATAPLMAWSRENLTCQFIGDRRYKQCKEWLTEYTVFIQTGVQVPTFRGGGETCSFILLETSMLHEYPQLH